LIYSAIKNGSDAAALSGLIEILLLGAFVIFLILRLRNSKKAGRLLVSQSARTNTLRNFLADHAAPIIAALCCLAFVLTFHVWKRYSADRRAITSGNYRTVVGTLDEYRTASVTRYHHTKRILDGVAGLDSTLREQDAIIVDGRTFYIACDKPLDVPLPTIGNEGRCLALRTG
jgi:hypothetical protein